MQILETTKVEIPCQLDFLKAINTVRELSCLQPSKRFTFDFSSVKFYEPFAMLYFSAQLRSFRDRHKKEFSSACNAIGYDNNSSANIYAANMGFFTSFGLNYAPGRLPGNPQYRPIKKITISELKRQTEGTRDDVRDVLERECLDIAAILLRRSSGELHGTLGYSLREIFRNVIEHSKAEEIWYTAQYWPDNGTVELSILDEGIGIRHALLKNPHLKITCDLDALKLALLPGISGKAFKGRTKRCDDPWTNSGYGLYMTSQLCARGGGSFFVGSGDAGIHMSDDRYTDYKLGFTGTVVRMVFDVTQIKKLSVELSQLTKEGARIAGDLKQAAIITASKSSSMLARDFNNP